MIPKDFRDRILEGMHREIKINYRKWLVQGKEIDMFELLAVLIIYSRCDLNRRLELIFKLFCFNEEVYMQKGEFKYMMNKLCNSIAATIQVKAPFMQELMRNVDAKLLVHNKEYVYERDFVNSMNLAFKELNERLSDITSMSDNFSLNLRVNRLPQYLYPGNNFLGLFKITDVVPHTKIEAERLEQYPSVFLEINAGVQEFDSLVVQTMRHYLIESQKCLHHTNSASKDVKLKSINDWNQFMAAGDLDVASYWSGSASRSAAAGLPVQFVVPQEGAIGWLDGLAVPASSKNVDAAHAFINWMIDPAFYSEWNANGAPASANSAAAAALPEDAFNRKVLGDPKVAARVQFMQPVSAEDREAYLEMWQSLKAAQ